MFSRLCMRALCTPIGMCTLLSAWMQDASWVDTAVEVNIEAGVGNLVHQGGTAEQIRDGRAAAGRQSLLLDELPSLLRCIALCAWPAPQDADGHRLPSLCLQGRGGGRGGRGQQMGQPAQ